MGRKAKAWTPSERKLLRLLEAALHQLQDDEALLSELVEQKEPVLSERTRRHLHNTGSISAHVQGELRDLGMTLSKREPFEDNTPIWALLQAAKGNSGV